LVAGVHINKHAEARWTKDKSHEPSRQRLV